mgnify:CR=1 FL=1|uniref:Ribulose-phosphate 3-epimerase n=1 Tax=candidate division CPR3 bacterium TaxID=2268181 RepID=A0A7C4R2Z9_UNCC3
MTKKIIPAILATTIEEFNEKLNHLLSFSNEIQIDVMDGAFVKESSFDLFELNSLPEDKKFECHLMVAHPLEYINHMKRLGIKKVVFHDEIDEDTETAIEGYKKEGFEVFLAINPETEPGVIEKYISIVGGIMLMSVEPGKSGQEFIHSSLVKARYLREKYPDLILEMDGGINKENIKDVFESGVNIVAIGSGILKAQNPEEEWEELVRISKL